MKSGEMEIDNGITERERSEVVAAIEAIAHEDAQQLKKATDELAHAYCLGCKLTSENILNYLKKRWQC